MSDYTSGNISFAGLGSGTDFNTMIEGLVKLERININRLESWKTSWSSKIDKFQELNTALLSLQTTLKSMDTLDEFMTRSATSSDEDSLTATANSQALVSAHTIEINQLAQNDVKVVQFGTDSLKDSIFSSTGQFSFSYKGESITLSNIPAGTTMEGFVSMINAHADTRDVIRASTINDGEKFHLQIYGMDLGEDNQLVISNTSGMIYPPASFLETQSAQNAQIKVDGYPPGAAEWIERDTNSISDAIDGITLNLKKPTNGSAISLGITTDSSGMKENIEKFVEENNKVRTMIMDLTAVDTTSDSANGSLLTGNYGVELLVGQRLKDIISNKAIGFSWYTEDTAGHTSGDKYSALSQLGILTNADSGGDKSGLLEIKDEDLDKALKNDPMGVAQLFATNYQGESESPEIAFLSQISGVSKPGEYNVQYEISGGKLISATIDGHEALVDSNTWQITGKPGNPESGIALRVESRADGVFGNSNSSAADAINVHLKLGKIGEMSEALTEMTGEEGPLSILEDNYKTIIKNIDTKIEREERRVDNKERMLKDKFSRLDTLLGKYQGQQAQLASSINQLTQG